MISAIQIGKALQHARFPIRSFEELYTVLHEHLNGGEHRERCEIDGLASIFSPRDFLFSNAGQVQRIVEARQCALAGEEDDAH